MADFLVTGIAPVKDASAAAQMLAGAALDQTCLSMVTKTSGPAIAAKNDHSGGPSFSSSSTIMTGSSGTGVPGVGGSNASLSSLSSHAGVADYLGGIPLIPADQAANFNIAIAEGRTLVMYKAAPEEAPAVEAAFRAAGFRNVKIFKPKVLEENLG
jgi:rhodanese-related sulfurtransferase